ncbi:hypothetical protein J6590_002616 [Homalodisca vitripennis]|nr:hypothetical protein J6590_002616 [Homalodisca vitripennis]
MAVRRGTSAASPASFCSGSSAHNTARGTVYGLSLGRTDPRAMDELRVGESITLTSREKTDVSHTCIFPCIQKLDVLSLNFRGKVKATLIMLGL